MSQDTARENPGQRDCRHVTGLLTLIGLLKDSSLSIAVPQD